MIEKQKKYIIIDNPMSSEYEIYHYSEKLFRSFLKDFEGTMVSVHDFTVDEMNTFMAEPTKPWLIYHDD